MNRCKISAFPHEGANSYWRANHKWTDEPIEVTILAENDPDGAEAPKDRPAYTITPKQLEQLKADRRMRIESADAPTVTAPKESQSQTESKRLEEAAKEAEKHNQRGR